LGAPTPRRTNLLVQLHYARRSGEGGGAASLCELVGLRTDEHRFNEFNARAAEQKEAEHNLADQQQAEQEAAVQNSTTHSDMFVVGEHGHGPAHGHSAQKNCMGTRAEQLLPTEPNPQAIKPNSVCACTTVDRHGLAAPTNLEGKTAVARPTSVSSPLTINDNSRQADGASSEQREATQVNSDGNAPEHSKHAAEPNEPGKNHRYKEGHGGGPEGGPDPQNEATELTFEEAMNKRDVGQIDKAIEAAYAKRRKADANSETDQGQAVHKQSERSRAGLDDAEGDANFEDEPEDEDQQIPEGLSQSEAEGTQEQSKGTIRRRLRRKTEATADHGYTTRPLNNLQAHRVLMHKFKTAQKRQRAEIKAARNEAIELLAMQPPGGAFDQDEGYQAEPGQQPHPSHRIIALEGNSTTIFCKHCGSWSKSDRLKHLALPCQPSDNGKRHSLRLLQCGVMPKEGATIPMHLKLRYGRQGRRRKSRW